MMENGNARLAAFSAEMHPVDRLTLAIDLATMARSAMATTSHLSDAVSFTLIAAAAEIERARLEFDTAAARARTPEAA